MATYKLMQDIEAEDHILGPLSLRQFIFALIAVFLYYIGFLMYSKGAAFLIIFVVPPALFFTFFALPLGKDQPTEVWALARLHYLFKPRRRVWDQDGAKELVTITVPKKVEHVYTDGLSETEVHSRLSALASTLDTRGWAVKNVYTNGVCEINQYGYAAPVDSERLMAVTTAQPEVPNYEMHASDDILDEQSNPIAQQFDHMIIQSAHDHRQELIDTMNRPASVAAPVADNNWFMSNLPASGNAPLPIAAPAPVSVDEAALAAQLKASSSAQDVGYENMHTLQPSGVAATQLPAVPALIPAPPAPAAAVTPDPDPAILSLANNNDLNVATLAREAQKARPNTAVKDLDEVVISLH